MAYFTVPQIGNDGACPEPCNHLDCKATHDQAATICKLCGRPIGYGGRMVSNDAGEFEHWECALKAAEAK